MAASNTEIANLALSHLNIGYEIANLDTEDSEEAAACRRFYDVALRATLEDAPWGFARKYAVLGLVQVDPNVDWDRSFRWPADCLAPRRIPSGVRVETRQSEVPFAQGFDGAGRLIFTDQETPTLEYTAYTDNEAIYPNDFVLAFSYKLAMLIAPRLTKGDPFKIAENARQMYLFMLAKAVANTRNTQQADEEPPSEFQRARG